MIRDFLRRVFALVKKEFITIWKDPKSRGIIIALPLLQLFVFANAITMEVKNIDVAVIDRDNSVESRELLSRFENSPRFRRFYILDNEKDFKEKIDTQRVQIGIYINNDFSSAVKSNRPVDVLIVADGRQTNSASIASGYASQIIASYNREISASNSAVINPVLRNWYNPNLEYRWYILTILVAMLALVITLLLTALSIAREREMGTFDQLIVSPLSSFEILLGKTIPPLVIAMTLTCIMTILVIFDIGICFSSLNSRCGFVYIFYLQNAAAGYSGGNNVSNAGYFAFGIYFSNRRYACIFAVFNTFKPCEIFYGFVKRYIFKRYGDRRCCFKPCASYYYCNNNSFSCRMDF